MLLVTEFYEKVTALKSNNKKVLLALGGWNDSEGDKYSKMVNSPKHRKNFISTAVEFLVNNNFDGLDLDWEYPGKRGGAKEDKENFILLIQELHQVTT